LEAFVPIENEEILDPVQETPLLAFNVLEEASNYGKFSMEPLERGFGITLGNPLRRVLLGGIPGLAITWVNFEGVLHEYGSIPHVKEEVLALIQRVKEIRLKSLTERSGRMTIEVTGPGEVYAGDIHVPADMEIVNPELHLATLDSSEGKIQGELNAEFGQGYLQAQNGTGLPIGTLPVDAIFTPVWKVNYNVERTRVGQVTDYERLVIELWTDGTISPGDAIKKASQILIDRLALFTPNSNGMAGIIEDPASGETISSEFYNVPLERLDLSTRTLNALKRSKFNVVGEVLEQNKNDLLKIRNFGQRSLNELLEVLGERGFTIPDALSGRKQESENEFDDPSTLESDSVVENPKADSF